MLRFAPSPTGFMHIGNARVAVLNYLYAMNKKKKFFLRIDDTDRDRSKNEFVDAILEDLSWLGIRYEKIVKQSDRFKKYEESFNFLKNKNLIYPCFETAEELSLKRKVQLKLGKPPIYDREALKLSRTQISSLVNSGKHPHWRLKLDDEPIEWEDEIHGRIKFDHLSISDPVLFRSDEMPLFTITSVVDDIEFNVTNILRGDDHITNTAAQIKLFKYFGSSIPSFAHFPLMRSRSGQGLSKRFNSFSIRELRKKRIIPLILINYLQKIGSSSSIDNIEILEKLIQKFNINTFSKNSVLFNGEDLDRLNSKHIKTLSTNDLKKIAKISIDEKFWKIIKLNIDNFDDIEKWKKILTSNHIKQKVKVGENLFNLIKKNLPERIDSNTWSLWTKTILKEVDIKPKELFVKIRMMLTGKSYGPSMNELLTLFSRKEILKRISNNCEQ